jgi:zinc-ribbon domain
MICGYCGAEVSDSSSKFCARCGRSLEVSQPADVQVQHSTNSGNLNGVSGWLLLLCIALTLGIPFLTAYNWVKFSSRGIGQIPISSLAISIVMAAWSFTAGFLLWTIRPNAIRVAKAYFVAEMALPFVFGLRFLIELLSSRVEMSGWTIFAVFFRPLILGLIGYLYLQRSERVRATYARAASAAA